MSDRSLLASGRSVVNTAIAVPESFLDALIARVAEDCDAAVDEVRTRAAEIAAALSDARIHAFIPLLVEKQLRACFRRPPLSESRVGDANGHYSAEARVGSRAVVGNLGQVIPNGSSS